MVKVRVRILRGANRHEGVEAENPHDDRTSRGRFTAARCRTDRTVVGSLRVVDHDRSPPPLQNDGTHSNGDPGRVKSNPNVTEDPEFKQFPHLEMLPAHRPFLLSAVTV
jgi:hypothetical protein